MVDQPLVRITLRTTIAGANTAMISTLAATVLSIATMIYDTSDSTKLRLLFYILYFIFYILYFIIYNL